MRRSKAPVLLERHARWKAARGALAGKLEDTYSKRFGPALVVSLKGPNHCGVRCTNCRWWCYGYFRGDQRLRDRVYSTDRRRAVIMAAARHHARGCGQGATR